MVLSLRQARAGRMAGSSQWRRKIQALVWDVCGNADVLVEDSDERYLSGASGKKRKGRPPGICERNEEWEQPYITNLVYELKVPKLLYAVCTDQNGKKFLLIEKCKRKSNTERVPFDNNTILLTDLNSKDVDYSVEIEIKDNP